MRMRVDHAADAVYLNLTDRPIKDTEEVADSIVVDYDDDSRIVDIENPRCIEAHRRPDRAQATSFRGSLVFTRGRGAS